MEENEVIENLREIKFFENFENDYGTYKGVIDIIVEFTENTLHKGSIESVDHDDLKISYIASILRALSTQDMINFICRNNGALEEQPPDQLYIYLYSIASYLYIEFIEKNAI